MSRQKMPEFEIEKSEKYREIHVDGVIGGLNPNGAKITLYTEVHKPKMKRGGRPGAMGLDKVIRKLQAELHISPLQFKNLFKWMEQHLEQFEDKFGEIKIKRKGKGRGKGEGPPTYT